MAEQIVSDLIMKFETETGAIEGETLTQLTLSRSPMWMGFTPGKMFEVASFTFKTGINGEDADEAAEKAKKQQDQNTARTNQNIQQLAAHANMNLPGLKIRSGMGFAKFRAGAEGTAYPVDLKPVEFSRTIDKSSPTMLQHCINRKVFKSATLIKRKAAGGPSAGEVFLRFDFNTVLLKQVEWDNEEPIKENCEFVCRAVTIHYLPQLPDGTLGAAKQAFWSASPTLKPLILTS